MALSILMIIMIIMGLLLIGTIFAAFFSEGKLQKNKMFLCLAAALILIMTFLAVTAFPSNYLLYKIISMLFAFIGIVGIYLTGVKSINYKIVGILITISLIGNFYMAFFK